MIVYKTQSLNLLILKKVIDKKQKKSIKKILKQLEKMTK